MTYPTLRQLSVSAFACLLALPFTNCSSDSKSTVPATGSADAGQAGESSVSICGNVAAVSQCDPVTALGCDIAGGQTCDHSVLLGGFKCFDGPNSSGPGQACDLTANFCGPSTLCSTDFNICQHYCCKDDDCIKGTCHPMIFSDGAATVGACSDEFVSSSGEAGSGGASEGGAGGAGG